jgi:hypothetical protein
MKLKIRPLQELVGVGEVVALAPSKVIIITPT